jgi:type IV pilus assembly protein PilE
VRGLDDYAYAWRRRQMIYKPASVKNFAIDCAWLAGGYTVTATDSVVFSIDQTNAHTTTTVPAGWTTSTVCWVSRKNGDC